MKLADLTAFLDRELRIADFPGDCSNNGLQVEGDSEVTKAVFAVDASLESMEYAEDVKADLLFVHHGISWGGGLRRFTGMTARRLKVLFNSGISLYAAHLPLDAHPELGNNVRLCRGLGLKELRPFCRVAGTDIGFTGELVRRTLPETLVGKLKRLLGTPECDFYGDPEARVRTIAVVSGSADENLLHEAAEAGAELLITGEISHPLYHPARELGVNIIAAGHYATETPGPRAVMEKVSSLFDIEVEFADLPTGM